LIKEETEVAMESTMWKTKKMTTIASPLIQIHHPPRKKLIYR
jgi:hypothetical protein